MKEEKLRKIDRICLEARHAEIDLAGLEYFEGHYLTHIYLFWLDLRPDYINVHCLRILPPATFYIVCWPRLFVTLARFFNIPHIALQLND